MKVAGIKPLTRNDSNFVNELKQSALLFDKVGIPLLDPLLKLNANSNLTNELLLLRSKDFIFDAWQQSPVQLSKNVDLKKIQAELDFMTNLRRSGADGDLMFEASARQCAMILNNQYDKPEFFSVPLLKRLSSAIQNEITKHDVLQIVIENIPIPDEKTPWENIWDFKADTDNIGRISGLRTWINEITSSSIGVSEIKDNLEYKLYQYRKSMDNHKIKYRSGVLKSFVIGSAEFLENIARLKFSNIIKGFFSANQEKIDLLNVELNAPGHELAYIYQAQETFK